MADLSTINTALVILAVVSVLEALVVLGIGVGAFLAYRRITALAADLEQRHVQPLAARVNGILDDVKGITAKAQLQAERVDQAIAGTLDRVDVTADRMRHTVMGQVARVTGVVRGVREAIASVLSRNGGSRGAPAPVKPFPGARAGGGY